MIETDTSAIRIPRHEHESLPQVAMAPMGIRLSPLGVAVFCLLGLGVIYHLYAGVLSNRISFFRQKKKVDLTDLLAVSIEAARMGGVEVKKVREDNTLEEKAKGETKEGAKELLTQGDLHSHRKMFNFIKNTFPDVMVHSEEHDDSADSVSWNQEIPADILTKVKKGLDVDAESITVWIDPLDATQEYTENLVKFVTTMVCVAVDGRPVIGVIHQPFTDFTAWGFVDHGSNMQPRKSYSNGSPKVIVSRSHSGEVKNFIRNAFGNTTVIPAGGAGYKVLSLLEMPSNEENTIDQADVYIHITFIKKWDICAGAALLKSLGGHMTTLKGEDIDYSGTPLNKGGLVATVGLDHKAVLEKLPEWDPEKH